MGLPLTGREGGPRRSRGVVADTKCQSQPATHHREPRLLVTSLEDEYAGEFTNGIFMRVPAVGLRHGSCRMSGLEPYLGDAIDLEFDRVGDEAHLVSVVMQRRRLGRIISGGDRHYGP